jgi:hypothetical protein
MSAMRLASTVARANVHVKARSMKSVSSQAGAWCTSQVLRRDVGASTSRLRLSASFASAAAVSCPLPPEPCRITSSGSPVCGMKLFGA